MRIPCAVGVAREKHHRYLLSEPGTTGVMLHATSECVGYARHQAAAFIGVSAPTFMVVCPIQPIALGPGKRLERYDVRALDAWIDKLGQRNSVNTDWLAVLDAKHDDRSR